MRHWSLKYFFVLILVLIVSCAQANVINQEYIQPPINLTITKDLAGNFTLTFFSDNREGGFSGYGIFQDPSPDVLKTNTPADSVSAAAAFCPLNGQMVYERNVSMYVSAGTAASTAAICNVSNYALTTGNYVALRARVERTTNSWSKATVVLIP